MRIAGNDRYATSVEISKSTFDPPTKIAFIASGENFPDALAGGPAAGALEAPLLLTTRDSLPPTVAAELRRLAPERTVILGGPGTVSATALKQIEELTGTPVDLWAGLDRYDTSARIAVEMAERHDTYYVTSGEQFADALAAGPAAIREGAALLLTSRDALNANVSHLLASRKPSRIVIVGGVGSVSAAVEASIRAQAPDAKVVRLAGRDRYHTAQVVAETVWSEGSTTTFFASGSVFADALAGTPIAGVNDAPILLTSPSCHPFESMVASDRLGASLHVALGGVASAYTGEDTCGPKPTYPMPLKDLDCKDFGTRAAAQAWFDYWYPRVGDVYQLDANKNGVVCEHS
jgi:putative cell wall-binding protein